MKCKWRHRAKTVYVYMGYRSNTNKLTTKQSWTEPAGISGP